MSLKEEIFPSKNASISFIETYVRKWNRFPRGSEKIVPSKAGQKFAAQASNHDDERGRRNQRAHSKSTCRLHVKPLTKMRIPANAHENDESLGRYQGSSDIKREGKGK